MFIAYDRTCEEDVRPAPSKLPGYEADQSGRGAERAREMPKEEADQQGVGAG